MDFLWGTVESFRFRGVRGWFRNWRFNIFLVTGSLRESCMPGWVETVGFPGTRINSCGRKCGWNGDKSPEFSKGECGVDFVIVG